MRRKTFIATLLVAFVAVAASSGRTATGQSDPPHQQEDPGIVTRGAFFSTRPAGGTKKPAPTTPAATATAPPRTSRPTSAPKTVATKKPAPNPGSKNGTKPMMTTSSTATPVGHTTPDIPPVPSMLPDGSMAVPDAAAIGMGYTLYMRDANGDAIRVDPAREFSEGDRIRALLEANTDGYLYIFHTEDGNSPQMLFPDAKLDGGRNDLRAHVPYQVPGALVGWFKFDDRPAIERLYVVVSRTPLAGVPIGAALVKQCADNPGGCVWRPTAAMWAQLKSDADAPVVVAQSKDEGQKLTEGESQALTRGLGLSLEAPPPTIIRMNTSSNAGKMVTTIDLVHK